MSRETHRIDETDARAFALPAVIAKNERIVREGFWRKVRRVAGRVPFSEDVAAAWYCAMDSRTPSRVKGVILAALAYFVMPADMVPDIVAALGFTDDAAVLTAALSYVGAHITPEHRAKAREALLHGED